MSLLIALPALADEVAAGAGSLQFATLLMDTTKQPGLAVYQFESNTACWINQGANPTASAAAGSMFVGANQPVLLDGSNGAKLAVIQDAVAGKASLTPMMRVA